MEPRPQADVNCPWQILRLKCKILGDDILRARQELLETKTKGNRDQVRIARLEQAHRAQQRALTALSRVVYPS
jgi:hypothetical protein